MRSEEDEIVYYRFASLSRKINLIIFTSLFLYFASLLLGVVHYFEIPYALFFFTNQNMLILTIYLALCIIYCWKDYNLEQSKKPGKILRQVISLFHTLTFGNNNIVAIIYWLIVIHFDFKNWGQFSADKKIYYIVYTLGAHLVGCMTIWIFELNQVFEIKKINYLLSFGYLCCYSVVYAYYSTWVRKIYGPLTLKWYPTYVLVFFPFAIQYACFKLSLKMNIKRIKTKTVLLKNESFMIDEGISTTASGFTEN